MKLSTIELGFGVAFLAIFLSKILTDMPFAEAGHFLTCAMFFCATSAILREMGK